jgi:uroporphyrinogen decarboxylase
MQGSIERVRAVLRGDTPDRPPLYDLLRNDAVLSHFTGEKLTLENAERVVFDAVAPAIDATRPAVRLPQAEKKEVLPDGRAQHTFRWTVWTAHANYADVAAFAAVKRGETEAEWTPQRQAQMDQFMVMVAEHRQKLGEVFFLPSVPGMGLMSLYGTVGLEQFSYYQADNPGLMEELLELQTWHSTTWIEHLPDNHGIEAVFCGDDIAYKSGPLLSPAWFKEHYFHRLARICAAYHRQGIKVLFHSDGNLNPILDGLVEAGIDGLNPIEVLAGMDVGDIHRRYPHLFMAGGIDVSQLLPYGKPQEVKDAVHRALDAAGGRLMVGSSTELNDAVPLENFLALREAVLNYRG